ncbi:MAG: YcfL family protein [Puniceicoccales bacterium]|nr:YcfL family protein [Puniceicoccales bacterium]
MKKRIQSAFGFLLLAVAALGVSGCAESNTIEGAAAEKRGALTKEQLRHIRNDAWFSTQATPVALNVSKAGDGESMKVQLLVKNDKWFGRSLRFNYKVLWYDADGLVLAGYDPPTRSIFINAGETVPIVAVAPRAAAKDFQFVFIEEM